MCEGPTGVRHDIRTLNAPTPKTELTLRVVRKAGAFVNYDALSGDFNIVFGVRGVRKLWQTPVSSTPFSITRHY